MLRRLKRNDMKTDMRKADMKNVTEKIVINRLKWRMRVGVLATLALAVLLTSPMMALANKSSDDFIAKSAPERVLRAPDAFAVIALDNGDEISFIGIPDERGRTGGVMVSEERSANRASMRSVEGLRDANPLELFNALAEPRSSVPAILVEMYGERSTLRHQGWARDLDFSAQPSFGECAAAADWGSDLDYYADAFNDEDPFKSTWDGPTSKPQHWATIPGNGLGGLQNKELNGQASDVTAFYGSVLYCNEDYENAATFNGQYIGNYVSFHYRVAGHGTWIFSQQTQLEDVGDRIDHLYYPGNLFSPGAAKFDFHLTISQAKPADAFHIGATWVYGGPTDIQLGS